MRDAEQHVLAMQGDLAADVMARSHALQMDCVWHARAQAACRAVAIFLVSEVQLASTMQPNLHALTLSSLTL